MSSPRATNLQLTGIPRLDDALGGGLPQGTLALIMGPPGSGKTTLANQMAFFAAAQGRSTIVFTALSEPTTKLISHLRSFSFFNADVIGDTLQFLSLQQFLSSGLEATADELIAASRATQAEFVALDGFRGVRGAEIAPQQARQFLYDIGATLSLQGTTTLITSEADPRDPAFFPESTTADVIIGLYYNLIGVHERRGLEVIKARGAAPLLGMHGLGIDETGIGVFPRIEARILAARRWSGESPASAPTTGAEADQPPSSIAADQPDHAGATTPSGEDDGDAIAEAAGAVAAPDAPASLGLPEFDALLDGGLSRGTCTQLEGSMGAGKTLLALYFALAGVRAGEPTVLVSFREDAQQLTRKGDGFAIGAELRAALTSGGLALLHWEPVDLDVDMVTQRLLNVIEETGARRLIVDGVAELARTVVESSDVSRIPNYFAALLTTLRARGVTSLFIKEIRPTLTTAPFDSGIASENDAPDRIHGLDTAGGPDPLGAQVENIVRLQQVVTRGRHSRIFAVVKTRFTPHGESPREFVITAPDGVRVLPGDPAP
ncbi:MAG TPA: ATPase domain-containing protein [Ktedonobacterales bacterium]|nr:ATPase domain-containing protein [Ktedonobacterales bacterium]